MRSRREFRGIKSSHCTSVLLGLLLLGMLAVGAAIGRAEDQPHTSLATESFDRDPGWEGMHNRVEASDPPTVKQDFGWTPASSIAPSGGKIGGTIWKSTTPAWYGMPLDPPLSFKDKFSASGKIAVMPDSGRGDVAYLGFFNHARQGWRAWSSMAMRIGSNGETASFFIDYMSGQWGEGAAEMECAIPADGTEQAWRFSYDPDATRPRWTDTRLRGYLTTSRQTVDDILAKAKTVEPEVTREEIEKRLQAALENGQVSYLPRRGLQVWLLKQDKDMLKGAITMEVAGNPVYKTFLKEEIRNQPVVLDRFGIFNQQMFHGAARFFVSDLVVNERKIDLSKDPAWEGSGNHAEHLQRDFKRLNFGYSSDSNQAGGKKGEIGGDFFGPPDHGFYADDVGKLTLDDAIHFSGKIGFIEGSTDAGMFFGFFNSADKKALLAQSLKQPTKKGWPQANTLGIGLDSGHYQMWAWCTPAKPDLFKRVAGPIFHPDRTHRTFVFDYDPQANDEVGRITVTLDGQAPFTLDLTPAQRKAGGAFDRFGLMSSKGAKYLTVFLDDLTYTVRRPKDYQPVHHKQDIIKVPFPQSGR